MLPVLDEGLAGMVWFAAAYTVFFVALTLAYANLLHNSTRAARALAG